MPLEVVHLEQLGAGLRGGAHQLGRVDLDEALLAPVLAHGVLHGGLHLEDQTPVGPAQVEIAPVDALVQRRLGRDRQFGLGRRIDVRDAS